MRVDMIIVALGLLDFITLAASLAVSEKQWSVWCLSLCLSVSPACRHPQNSTVLARDCKAATRWCGSRRTGDPTRPAYVSTLLSEGRHDVDGRSSGDAALQVLYMVRCVFAELFSVA